MNRWIVKRANRLRANYADEYTSIPHHRMIPTLGNHAPRAFAMTLSQAIHEATVLERASNLDWTWTYEDEDEKWDGEDPAPRRLVCVLIRDENERVIGSLGMVGVDSYDSPYLESCAAELFEEALAERDRAWDAKTTQDAIELAARATYAGVEPS